MAVAAFPISQGRGRLWYDRWRVALALNIAEAYNPTKTAHRRSEIYRLHHPQITQNLTDLLTRQRRKLIVVTRLNAEHNIIPRALIATPPATSRVIPDFSEPLKDFKASSLLSLP
jgi:hypothetical protein